MATLIFGAIGLIFIAYLILSVGRSTGSFKSARKSPGGGKWIVILILVVLAGLMVYATIDSSRPDVRAIIRGK